MLIQPARNNVSRLLFPTIYSNFQRFKLRTISDLCPVAAGYYEVKYRKRMVVRIRITALVLAKCILGNVCLKLQASKDTFQNWGSYMNRTISQ